MSHTISLGFLACSASNDKPMRAAAPGARFCTSTSAVANSSVSTAMAPSFFRSSVRLSLLRLVHTKWLASPFTRVS